MGDTSTENKRDLELEYVSANPRVILTKNDSIPVVNKAGNQISLADNERACNLIMKIKYTKQINAENTDEYLATVSLQSYNPSVDIINITDNGKEKVDQICYKIYPLVQGEKIYKFPLLLSKKNQNEYIDVDFFVVNIQKITKDMVSNECSDSFLITTR